jgi:hypothetical protein
MALIQQTDAMYLNITQSATELQRLRKKAGNKDIDSAIPVSVVLDDGTELGRKGKLLFSDVTVDPTSGQVTLRAEVANPDNALLPGQYVRVRLSQAELPSGILVPQQAVTRGGQGRHRHGRRRRQQAGPAHRQDRLAGRRELGRHRWPEGRREGHGRRLPEAADDAAGYARFSRCLGCASGGGTKHASAGRRRHQPQPPANAQ